MITIYISRDENKQKRLYVPSSNEWPPVNEVIVQFQRKQVDFTQMKDVTSEVGSLLKRSDIQIHIEIHLVGYVLMTLALLEIIEIYKMFIDASRSVAIPRPVEAVGKDLNLEIPIEITHLTSVEYLIFERIHKNLVLNDLYYYFSSVTSISYHGYSLFGGILTSTTKEVKLFMLPDTPPLAMFASLLYNCDTMEDKPSLDVEIIWNKEKQFIGNINDKSFSIYAKLFQNYVHRFLINGERTANVMDFVGKLAHCAAGTECYFALLDDVLDQPSDKRQRSRRILDYVKTYQREHPNNGLLVNMFTHIHNNQALTWKET